MKLAMTGGSSRNLRDDICLNRQRLPHIVPGMTAKRGFNEFALLVVLLFVGMTGSLDARTSDGADGVTAVSDAWPQLCAPTLVADTGQLKVYAVSPVRKVFSQDTPDAWGEVTSREAIQLSLARNESEPFFLVLRPSAELKDVTISFAASPESASGGKSQLNPSWSYIRVGEVPVPGISKWYGLGGWETGAVLDPLLSDDAFTAPANMNSLLLVETKTSSDVPPGIHSFSIHVHAGGRILATIPVELEVWDIVLPTTPMLQTLSHNLEVSERASWEFLQDAGVTALKYGPKSPSVTIDPGGTVHVDFRNYEKELEVLLNELGYDYILVPPMLLGSISTISQNYLSTGIPVGSEKFWPIYDQYMKLVGDFYRTNGWEDKVIFYMFDEIYEEYHELVIKLAHRARLQFPEVMVMISTHVMSDELAAALDAWCVPWHFFATRAEDVSNWRKWQSEGLELWAYMNSLYMLNAKKSLGVNRFFPPVLAKYGYKGNFWWGIAYNEGKDHWTELHRLGNQKQGMYGNGLLFYPPREKKTSQFEPWHSSLRWECYRQGLDEYELMEMLGERVTQVRRGLGEPGSEDMFSRERILQWWGSLLSSGFRMQTYRSNPEYIHRFRQLIAHEIRTISQQPAGIVEVEYASGPYTESDTAHIRGVCPAGTRVTVAGAHVTQGFSEEKPYLFWTDVSLRLGRNLIPVVLDDNQGTQKTVYREVYYQLPNED